MPRKYQLSRASLAQQKKLMQGYNFAHFTPRSLPEPVVIQQRFAVGDTVRFASATTARAHQVGGNGTIISIIGTGRYYVRFDAKTLVVDDAMLTNGNSAD